MKNKLIKTQLVVSSGILFLTGVAKIVSATGNAGILSSNDPVFGFPYKYLFYLTGIIELLIAFACYLNISQIARVGLIGWFALCVFMYRLAFHYLGPVHWCPCLGTFTERLRMSPKFADLLLDGALVYMIFGSLAVLISHYSRTLWKKCQTRMAG